LYTWGETGGNVTNLAPGQAVQKSPKVKLGADSRNAYVRMIVTGIGTSGNYDVFWWDTNDDNNDGKQNGLKSDVNPAWTKDSDNPGTYYYNYELTQENPETVPLFDSVRLKTGIDVNTRALDQIVIKAELIQSNYLNLIDSLTGVDRVKAAFALLQQP
jgi:hypothetical protein